MYKRIAGTMINIIIIFAYLEINFTEYNSFFHQNKAQFFAFIFPYILSDILIVALLAVNIFKRPKDIDDSNFIFFVCVLACNLPFVLSFFSNNIIPETRNMFLAGLGTVLNLSIMPFYLLSVIRLGSSLSVLPEANKLKTTGIYGFSRHPLYSCYIFWFIAQNLICQSWIMLVISIIQISMQIIRAKHEELILLKNYPEYREYKAKVWWFGRNIFYKANTDMCTGLQKQASIP
jgi:Putative protein-S-isoprenylcysteine methyltransferase